MLNKYLYNIIKLFNVLIYVYVCTSNREEENHKSNTRAEYLTSPPETVSIASNYSRRTEANGAMHATFAHSCQL